VLVDDQLELRVRLAEAGGRDAAHRRRALVRDDHAAGRAMAQADLGRRERRYEEQEENGGERLSEHPRVPRLNCQ
jgi:hypothetical protein